MCVTKLLVLAFIVNVVLCKQLVCVSGVRSVGLSVHFIRFGGSSPRVSAASKRAVGEAAAKPSQETAAAAAEEPEGPSGGVGGAV